MKESIQSRKAVLRLLKEVLIQRRPLDQITEKAFRDLPNRDQSFANALIRATLRHIGEIDALAASFMKRPFKEHSKEQNILRIGVAQLLFMDGVADYAAIDTTVELAKKEAPRVSNLVNAILRQCQRSDYTAQPSLNIPSWMQEQITADYGDKAEAVLTAMSAHPNLDVYLRDNSLAADYNAIAEKLPYTENSYRITDKSLTATALPGWAGGKVYVQEAMAQLPARLLSPLKVEGDVWDTCAAPGGKTIHLCDIFPERHIISSDINEKRLSLVKQNLKRCQLTNAKTDVIDARKASFEKESLAAALVDAPCTATGTTKRHVDVLYTRTAEDVTSLSKLQVQLLDATAPLIAPGGLLVYATCSLFKAEGEAQVEAFLERHSDFALSPITADEVGGKTELITTQGTLRATPDMGTDGFFAARFVKK